MASLRDSVLAELWCALHKQLTRFELQIYNFELL